MVDAREQQLATESIAKDHIRSSYILRNFDPKFLILQIARQMRLELYFPNEESREQIPPDDLLKFQCRLILQYVKARIIAEEGDAHWTYRPADVQISDLSAEIQASYVVPEPGKLTALIDDLCDTTATTCRDYVYRYGDGSVWAIVLSTNWCLGNRMPDAKYHWRSLYVRISETCPSENDLQNISAHFNIQTICSPRYVVAPRDLFSDVNYPMQVHVVLFGARE